MSNVPVTLASRPVVVPLDLARDRGAVQIRGPLAIDWSERLSSQLAVNGVTIRSLTARRGAMGWYAELDVASKEVAIDTIDFLALLEASSSVFVPTTLSLTHVRVEPRPEHGGCLLLTTEGADCVGFLAALLHTLAFQLLFPVEMRIRTFGSTAVDRIWVKGIGDSAPPADAAHRLERGLESLRARAR